LRVQVDPIVNDSLTPPSRKTLRVQASRNLSASLGGVTGATPTLQQQKIAQTIETVEHRLKKKEYRLHPEPKLEGLTSSQDLQLFREAQAKMREQLGVEMKQNYDLSKIQFGPYVMETWYMSPYPPEYTQIPCIYVCEFCLQYYKTTKTYDAHKQCCTQTRPLGREIYRKNKLSIFEVDGENHKEYCQNLCLLAKLFLNHKTLYFNVEPFLFYICTNYDDKGWHIIGYFSKEKHSPQGYNVSCILIMPPYMRKGYGRLLIDFSYLLTRQQQMVGSPERPLSDLGLLCYRSYWRDIVLTHLINNNTTKSISIKEIGQETGINPDDLVSSLQYYGLLKYWKGKHIIVKKKDVIEDFSRKLEQRIKSEQVLDPTCLQWTPCVYPPY
jgi:histone acetyltransferase MYST2